MKKSLFTLITFIHFGLLSAQVGIGTTTPSDAAMLHISSTSNAGTSYHALMPPRVLSQVQRDLINTDSLDAGLLVFVENTGTLEIWNGINWETIYTLSTLTTTLSAQDFDTNLTWAYTLTPAAYTVVDDIWDIVTTLGSGTGAIDLVNGNFLGCRDLDNPNGGGPFFHEIAFVDVDISTVTNARVAFDYDIFAFDNGDDVQYEVFHDGIGQGIVTLVNGVGDLTVQGTEIINVPNTVTNVRITVGISQNGAGDFAGFDNFRVYGQ